MEVPVTEAVAEAPVVWVIQHGLCLAGVKPIVHYDVLSYTQNTQPPSFLSSSSTGHLDHSVECFA